MKLELRNHINQAIAYVQFALTKGTPRQAIGSLWSLVVIDEALTDFSEADFQQWHATIQAMQKKAKQGPVSPPSVATFCNTLSAILAKYPVMSERKATKKKTA